MGDEMKQWQTTKGITVGDAVGYLDGFRAQRTDNPERMSWLVVTRVDRSRRSLFECDVDGGGYLDDKTIYCGTATKMWVRKAN
jgi:hypothetical protein